MKTYYFFDTLVDDDVLMGNVIKMYKSLFLGLRPRGKIGVVKS